MERKKKKKIEETVFKKRPPTLVPAPRVWFRKLNRENKQPLSFRVTLRLICVVDFVVMLIFLSSSLVFVLSLSLDSSAGVFSAYSHFQFKKCNSKP